MKKPEIRKLIGKLSEALVAVETGNLPTAPPGTAAKLFAARGALALAVRRPGNPSALGSRTTALISGEHEPGADGVT